MVERIDPELDDGDVCVAGAAGYSPALGRGAGGPGDAANKPQPFEMRITLSDNATLTFVK
jgi:hypothetical protein